MGVDRPGGRGQPGNLGDVDTGGAQLYRAVAGGEQRRLVPRVDDPGNARVADVLDTGDRPGGAGTAGDQGAVDRGLSQARIGSCLADGYLFGMVLVLLLAGGTGSQDFAVRGDYDGAYREGRAGRRALPGQLNGPAQESVVLAAGT